MPKRKKYPKLPNGYGTIRYLGKKRRNCYAVHPPAAIEEGTGRILRGKPICYVDAWIKGFTVLTAYKAGTYSPGMEKSLEIADTDDLEGLSERILADYNRVKGIEEEAPGKTFAEVFEGFWDYKYNRPDSKKYSESTKYTNKMAFRLSAELHNKEFASLVTSDLQGVIDNCQYKHATLEQILTLYKQMYDYAEMEDICEKNYSAYVKINREDDDIPGVPFEDKELKCLWDNQNNEIVEFILIMCYSGFRISAYKTLEVNLDKMYFKGGVKSRYSKERTVPIHSCIQPLVLRRMQRDGQILSTNLSDFRLDMYQALEQIKIEKHTPHDCRHTFSMLCEKYEVRENDRKRMMGHSFQKDITNQKYGHRTLEDLRKEIEKIHVDL